MFESQESRFFSPEAPTGNVSVIAHHLQSVIMSCSLCPANGRL